MQNGLSRSQTMALETLKEASSEEFQKVIANAQKTSRSNAEPEIKDSSQVELKDLSAQEIRGIAEKAVKKDMLTELKRSRVNPPSSQETVILLMNRLGVAVEWVTPLRG